MLIDSGATTTALSEATAKAAGITIDKESEPVSLSTANGTVEAWRGKIVQLNIDGLSARDVDVVVSASFGDIDVLGMNFLSQLRSWRVESGILILEPANDAPTDNNDTGSDLT